MTQNGSIQERSEIRVAVATYDHAYYTWKELKLARASVLWANLRWNVSDVEFTETSRASRHCFTKGIKDSIHTGKIQLFTELNFDQSCEATRLRHFRSFFYVPEISLYCIVILFNICSVSTVSDCFYLTFIYTNPVIGRVYFQDGKYICMITTDICSYLRVKTNYIWGCSAISFVLFYFTALQRAMDCNETGKVTSRYNDIDPNTQYTKSQRKLLMENCTLDTDAKCTQ